MMQGFEHMTVLMSNMEFRTKLYCKRYYQYYKRNENLRFYGLYCHINYSVDNRIEAAVSGINKNDTFQCMVVRS